MADHYIVTSQTSPRHSNIPAEANTGYSSKAAKVNKQHRPSWRVRVHVRIQHSNTEGASYAAGLIAPPTHPPHTLPSDGVLHESVRPLSVSITGNNRRSVVIVCHRGGDVGSRVVPLVSMPSASNTLNKGESVRAPAHGFPYGSPRVSSRAAAWRDDHDRGSPNTHIHSPSNNSLFFFVFSETN